MKNLITSLCLFAASALLLGGCDKTYVDDRADEAPVITSFTPESAPIGSEIIITGEHLSGVTTAQIGGKTVTIKEKVSDSRLSIIATVNGKSGQITLTNPTGNGSSESSFTYSYAVPQITTSLLQTHVDMGDNLLITGQYLGSVTAVKFTPAGDTSKSFTGTIVSQSNEELVVRVPYVSQDEVLMTLIYFNGTQSTETAIASAPTVTVKRDKPIFNTQTYARTAVGKSVTLTGTYLNKVDSIKVGGYNAVISKKEASELIFSVPAGKFADGDNLTDIAAVYFDGNESITLTNAFTVYVPYVMFWEGMRIYAQGRTNVGGYSSFFSPQTGIVYANEFWKTLVDPVSFANADKTCSAAQTPNVTATDYSSVNPYFFISGISAGTLQINSPANSSSQLKNFYKNATNPTGTTTDSNRITEASASYYGTPVLRFRYLDPANTTEKALIDQVMAGTLEKIDEKTFPIDVTNKMIAGIGIASGAGSISSAVWAPNIFTTGTEATDKAVNAVLLVTYYDVNGCPSTGNPCEHVKRIGFIHIRSVNFKMSSGSTPGASDMLFNCYWQKYDYDYSKILQ